MTNSMSTSCKVEAAWHYVAGCEGGIVIRLRKSLKLLDKIGVARREVTL